MCLIFTINIILILNQAENGKTELSLVHFTHTNPEWQPPMDSGNYITNLKERAVRDVNLPTLEEENPLFASLNSISSLGNEVAMLLKRSSICICYIVFKNP